MKLVDKIELFDIDDIFEYINNPKEHPSSQIDKLCSSIKNYGFTVPIVIDQDKEIIAGHGRYKAAKKLGLEKVPCIVREDLNEAQIKALRIMDNKSAESDWNMEMLAAELEELKFEDFDLELTGFDIEEIDEILVEEVPPEEVEEDNFEAEKAIEEIEEPVIQYGDVIEMGQHRLLCGDSTLTDIIMNKLMRNEKAQMVFTDPPWNVNYGDVPKNNPQNYKPRKILNDFMGTEEFKKFMCSAFETMNEISEEGCMTYVVMSAQEWGNLMLALAQNDYHWSSTIIWNKNSLVLSRKDYHTKYEPIWYGWKNGAPRLCPLEDRKQSDVWDIDRPVSSDLHPTTKPIEVPSRAIRNSSKPNDIVVDLFGGSGSTLIACEQLNRRCRTVELDEKYCDVIIRRYIEYKLKKDEEIIIKVNGHKKDYTEFLN